MTVRDFLDADVLRDLVPGRSHTRGVAYSRDGRVTIEFDDGDSVRAVVVGTLAYRVGLWCEHKGLRWSCSCPAADDGSFCRHCVAVVLTLDASDQTAAGTDNGTERTSNASRPKRRVAGASKFDIEGFRRQIDAAFRSRGKFVSYGEASGWAADIHDEIDALATSLDAGEADAVIELSEHLHRRTHEAIQYVDDDGWLNGISVEVAALHLLACRRGSPDPVDLAGRLIELETATDLLGFDGAAITYADVLGVAGLDQYERLVKPRWSVAKKSEDRWSSERFGMDRAMVSLAIARSDPDALLAHRDGNFRMADDYLEVANLMDSVGRHSEAFEWANKGLEADKLPFRNAGLRDFLAKLLRDRGEMHEANMLYWDAFQLVPSLVAYRRLIDEAQVDAPVWRERSLVWLRQNIDQLPQGDSDHRRRTSLASTLIEILLHEGDVESAWIAAIEHGCAPQLWMAMAREREGGHPLDAVGVYQDEVFRLIDLKKNRPYRDAVKLMGRIRTLLIEAGRKGVFDDLLQRVRTEHRPKRNLMALLDERPW